MYTGARVNELAQLSISDIAIEDGVPVIEITPAGDIDKRVKNATSRRTLPLHKDLLTLGFLSYVNNTKNHNERLFPALKIGPNGYSHYFVRHFTGPKGWLRQQLPGLVKGLAFHCFRHTFLDTLKNLEVGERLIEEIGGHKVTSISMSRYGKPYKADIRIKAINQIQYGFIPEVKEESLYDSEIDDERDYLACGDTTIPISLEQGTEPIEKLQYQRPDIHGYSPFHKEIESFIQD